MLLGVSWSIVEIVVLRLECWKVVVWWGLDNEERR
tara:strand:+ start:1736 stop:1840 length:105 start_codon:yes stop_codon:yes gene_type:complete